LEEPPEEWSEDVRLTEHERNDRKPRIATWGNVVHLVWDKSLGEDYGYVEVFYMKSENNGWTWSEPVQLSEHEYPAWNQDIAVYEDTVYVVWDQHGPAGAREIFFRRSLDGGDTWEEEQQITQPTGEWKGRPRVAVSECGATVHVVWMDERFRDDTTPPTIELYYKRSIDGGETWEGEKRLTEAPYGSGGHSLAVDGSTVHLVWMDERKGYELFDIYYRRSTDDGETWDSEIALTDDGNRNSLPDVAVWEGNPHVVWEERMADQDYAINYRRSTDGGDTWGPMQVLTAPSARVMRPKLAVVIDEIHVVWVDGRDHDYRREIYYKHSEDAGVSWSEDTRLTYSDEGRSYEPAISLSGDTIHVAWHDDRDGDHYEIYYKRNPDFNDDPISEFSTVVIPVLAVLVTYAGVTKYQRWKGN